MSENANRIELTDITQALYLRPYNISPAEYANDFVPAAISGLSEGDLQSYHDKNYSGRKARFYGSHDYSEGQVANRVLKAAIESARQETIFTTLQAALGRQFVEGKTSFDPAILAQPVEIRSDSIVVDGLEAPLPALQKAAQPRSRNIVELEAGITSRSYAVDQYNVGADDGRLFSFYPFSKTYFTSAVLHHTYNSFEPNLGRHFFENQLYRPSVGSMAEITTSILTGYRTRDEDPQILDTVLATNTHRADIADLSVGMANIYPMLLGGGSLILRGLVDPDASEIGISQLVQYGIEAGFSEANIEFGPQVDEAYRGARGAVLPLRTVQAACLIKS